MLIPFQIQMKRFKPKKHSYDRINLSNGSTEDMLGFLNIIVVHIPVQKG